MNSRLLLTLVLLLSSSLSASAQNPDFNLPSVDKKPLRLADFRGRWVIVNFWATWCTPCLMEMPELQAFYEAQQHRAVVVGINFEDSTAAHIRAFAQQMRITFPLALSGGKPVTGFDLKGLPMTFLISPVGKLVDSHLGTVNAAMLVERMDEFSKTAPSK